MFRVDRFTKMLIRRPTQTECRTLTNYCFIVRTEAATWTIATYETPLLSDRDRAVLIDAPGNPQVQSERLQHAFAEHRRLINH